MIKISLAEAEAASLEDFHNAPTEGPLHNTWMDKPHRVLYDLVKITDETLRLLIQTMKLVDVGLAKVGEGDCEEGKELKQVYEELSKFILPDNHILREGA